MRDLVGHDHPGVSRTPPLEPKTVKRHRLPYGRGSVTLRCRAATVRESVICGYSYRSADKGFTRVARNAGM
jgi:hypothetical protein